jgi:hypothetical protein
MTPTLEAFNAAAALDAWEAWVNALAGDDAEDGEEEDEGFEPA